MYNMEQIQQMIYATPKEMRGQPLEKYQNRAVSIGRILDKQMRAWYMVYAMMVDGKVQHFIAKRGVIQ